MMEFDNLPQVTELASGGAEICPHWCDCKGNHTSEDNLCVKPTGLCDGGEGYFTWAVIVKN